MNRVPHLYERQVTPAELKDAVDAFKDKVQYLYLESEGTLDLVSYPDHQHRIDPAWTRGRAFGPQLEVRWQKAQDVFDLLLLTETALDSPCGWQQIPKDDPQLPCPDSCDPADQVILWGLHASRLQKPHWRAGSPANVWTETRIPRAPKYPASGQPLWVKARIIVYCCQGQPVLTRLAGLEREGGNESPGQI